MSFVQKKESFFKLIPILGRQESVSFGETKKEKLEAVIEGVRRAGAEVVEIIAVVEKGGGLRRLQDLYPDLRIQSLVRLEMDGDKVVLLDED